MVHPMRRTFRGSSTERGLGAWLSFRREKVPGTPPIALRERLIACPAPLPSRPRGERLSANMPPMSHHRCLIPILSAALVIQGLVAVVPHTHGSDTAGMGPAAGSSEAVVSSGAEDGSTGVSRARCTHRWSSRGPSSCWLRERSPLPPVRPNDTRTSPPPFLHLPVLADLPGLSDQARF